MIVTQGRALLCKDSAYKKVSARCFSRNTHVWRRDVAAAVCGNTQVRSPIAPAGTLFSLLYALGSDGG